MGDRRQVGWHGVGFLSVDDLLVELESGIFPMLGFLGQLGVERGHRRGDMADRNLKSTSYKQRSNRRR
jgi:hypothetical protein